MISKASAREGHRKQTEAEQHKNQARCPIASDIAGECKNMIQMILENLSYTNREYQRQVCGGAAAKLVLVFSPRPVFFQLSGCPPAPAFCAVRVDIARFCFFESIMIYRH